MSTETTAKPSSNDTPDEDAAASEQTDGAAGVSASDLPVEQQSGDVDLSGEVGPSLKNGVAVITAMVRQLPNAPGVYRMYNADGDVLYVGKARSLKKRVLSYTRLTGQSHRIARMITQTASMEFVRTHTETEALLLEANLIKRLRPRFNVLLRDDKSFPYILIADDHVAPQIVKHRGARKRKGNFYGPFASAGAVNRTINALQKAFLLRNCTDSVYESRTRPCLMHQIKRCAAPCTGEISIDDYKVLVDEAHAFLSGKSKAVQDTLSVSMQDASERLDFETAAVYRDRLAALSHVQSHQGINPHSVEEADVFACYQDGGQTCIQVFFFRTGQNWGNRAYFPRADKSLSAAEVLESFLAQFYDDKPCPKLVLLSEDIVERELLQDALTERSSRKVTVFVPRRGEKRELVDHALSNAKEAHGRKLADTSSQEKLLAGLAETLGLDSIPRRIEVYDNSHIMGTNAVGGMIVSGPDGFAKNQYRKFNIKNTDLTPGDDYGMMREVMQRRFSRLLKESGSKSDAPRDENGFGPWPDLVLIDGGLGQLNAVRGIIDELDVDDVAFVGVAKGVDRDAGREVFHIPGKKPFRLPVRDPVLYFIQRLRDEAHRFAIGTHRAKRKADMTKNPLDEIAGIGPTRKRALLHHFGTAKAVSRAAMNDLTTVEGVSEQTAQVIYDFFHEKAE